MKIMTRSLLLSTAMAIPLAGLAMAQPLININEEQLAKKSQECQDLGHIYNDRNDPEVVAKEAVITAINNDVANECAALTERVTASAETGTTDEAADAQATDEEKVSEEVSEVVDLSQEATIQGQAEVTVPEPNVDVQVPAPNITVTEQQPRVSVGGQAMNVQVAQKQPTISVEIPEIIVRVDNPAPDIYILKSDPSVSVMAGDPQVQVEQGEPVVKVTQADPQLNVDLGVEAEGTAGETDQANAEAVEQSGEAQNVAGDTEVVSTEPQVRIVKSEGQPEVTFEQGEMQVDYQSAEPKISVMMAEQPKIEIQQTGEPNVVLETQEERDQRLAQKGEAEATTDEAQPDMSGDAAGMLTVAQLMDMDVITADGEDLGNPEAVIDNNGTPSLVLASGGFLGLGEKQVPVSLERVTIKDDRLVVDGMTEEDIEAANDFEYDSALEMDGEQQVQLGAM